jgi:hypothetical protein
MDRRRFSALPPETQQAIRAAIKALGVASLGLAARKALVAKAVRRSLAAKKRAEERRQKKKLRVVRPPKP